MSDPWSSLQAPGVVADDAAPAGAVLAYEDGAHVGFPLGQPLPAMCVKCAEDGDFEGHELTFKPSLASAKSVTIGFPMCDRCRKQRTLAWVLVGLWIASPFLVILGITLQGFVGVVGTAVLWLGIISMISGTLITPFFLKKIQLSVARFDSDGFVRLQGAHPSVRAEIVRAAQEQTDLAIAHARAGG